MFTLYTLSHYHDIPMISPFLWVQYPSSFAREIHPSIHRPRAGHSAVLQADPESRIHLSHGKTPKMGDFFQRSVACKRLVWLHPKVTNQLRISFCSMIFRIGHG